MSVLLDANREVLTIVNTPTKSSSGLENVLNDLEARGVTTVRLISSDALTGIGRATVRQFQGCRHQLCIAHFNRNLLNLLRSNWREVHARVLERVLPNPPPTPLTLYEDPRCGMYSTVLDLSRSV